MSRKTPRKELELRELKISTTFKLSQISLANSVVDDENLRVNSCQEGENDRLMKGLHTPTSSTSALPQKPCR